MSVHVLACTCLCTHVHHKVASNSKAYVDALNTNFHRELYCPTPKASTSQITIREQAGVFIILAVFGGISLLVTLAVKLTSVARTMQAVPPTASELQGQGLSNGDFSHLRQLLQQQSQQRLKLQEQHAAELSGMEQRLMAGIALTRPSGPSSE